MIVKIVCATHKQMIIKFIANVYFSFLEVFLQAVFCEIFMNNTVHGMIFTVLQSTVYYNTCINLN
jgi:hypothetical protein